MDVKLTERSADATQFIGAEAAFGAFSAACSTYQEMAFRICSGGTWNSYRLSGWHCAGGRTYWLQEEA